MIGDIPPKAGLRCRLGRHKPGGAGLLIYSCQRCGGDFFWKGEARKRNQAALVLADAAIDRGDYDEAERIKQEAVGG